MKERMLYCQKCKKPVEIAREVVRTYGLDRVISSCVECGEVLEIIDLDGKPSKLVREEK